MPPTFAAYAGPSMHPTLVEPEVIEIEPYPDAGAVRPGDVIFFHRPGQPAAVVHRVVRAAAGGFVTRGDNNPRDDPGSAPFARIAGRVVAAQRGNRRRTIRGGRAGLARHYLLRAWRLAARAALRALRPACRALAGSAVLARLVPRRLKPRVVVFQSRGERILRLVLGGRVVGRYDPARREWIIRRPYRLLVDERRLPRS